MIYSDPNYTGWQVDSFANTLRTQELEDEDLFLNQYGFTTQGIDNDDVIRQVLSIAPQYGDPNNSEYITDLDRWRHREQVRNIERSGQYDHVEFAKDQTINMVKQLQAGTPQFVGGLLDPATSGGAVFHNMDAFFLQMAKTLRFDKYFDEGYTESLMPEKMSLGVIIGLAIGVQIVIFGRKLNMKQIDGMGLLKSKD